MTLIIAMVNKEQAVLVSDRRLTVGGRTVDDDSNKAATIELRDARLAVAFTGLARTTGFTTSRWLSETLTSVAGPEYTMGPLLERFARRAESNFSRLSDTIDKRVSFVFAGYSYAFHPPRPYLWRISNFEGGPSDQPAAKAVDEFTMVFWRGMHPQPDRICLLQAAGNKGAVSQSDLSALHDLIHAVKPARALVGKALKILRAASDSPKAAGTIGKQATSVILPSNPELISEGEYHSDHATHKLGGMTYIEARGGERGVWVMEPDSFEIYDAADRPVISSVPKVARNHPCPCGNGKKFKHCHGRIGVSQTAYIIGGGGQ